MNRIKKYIIILGIFSLVTIMALMIPGIYFKHMDIMIINNVNKNEINLSNIYDNYNLSNLEKIEIMTNDPIQLLGHDTPSDENYTKVVDTLEKELKKIDKTLYENIFDMINTNYNNVRDFYIETMFLSSEDLDKSLVIRNISIETDTYSLYCYIDVYDNTLLSFSIIASDPFFASVAFDHSIRDEFAQYLKIESKYVEFIHEPNSLSMQIRLDYNKEEAVIN